MKTTELTNYLRPIWRGDPFISSVSALSEAPNCCENINMISTCGVTHPWCLKAPLATATFWPERISWDTVLWGLGLQQAVTAPSLPPAPQTFVVPEPLPRRLTAPLSSSQTRKRLWQQRRKTFFFFFFTFSTHRICERNETAPTNVLQLFLTKYLPKKRGELWTRAARKKKDKN